MYYFHYIKVKEINVHLMIFNANLKQAFVNNEKRCIYIILNTKYI